MIIVFDRPAETPIRIELNAVPRIGESIVLDGTFWEVIAVRWDVDTYRSSGLPEVVVELAEQ